MGLIRVFLALAVLLSHLPMATFKFMSGGLAVQSFFIVSGFYMALVLDGKYTDKRLFYSNRLFRLFPTYFAMCVVAAVTLFVFQASPTANLETVALIARDPVTLLVMIVQNIILVGQDLLFWFTIDTQGAMVFDTTGAVPTETVTLAWQGLLIPQSWSLSMELLFYGIAPWVARLHWRWIAGLAMASAAFRLFGHLLPVDYLLWQGRLFPSVLFLFLMGMLAHRTLDIASKFPSYIGWIMAVLMLAFIAFCPLLPIDPAALRWTTYLLIAVSTPWIFQASRNSVFDRWIGDLSYPVYLSQLATIGFVMTYAPPYPVAVAIISTFLVSAFIVLVIEHPIDRWRQKRLNSAREGGNKAALAENAVLT